MIPFVTAARVDIGGARARSTHACVSFYAAVTRLSSGALRRGP